MRLHQQRFLVNITGKRINREAGYGMELPCEFKFPGDKFSCDWPEEKVKKKKN